MSRGARLLAIATIQTLLLAGMVAPRAYTVLTGTKVILAAEPVDPRSLFSGDYVRLGYDFASGFESVPGESVEVLLLPDQPTWRAVPAPDGLLPPDGVLLRGTAGYGGRAEFGIETFYLPEGRGREIEGMVFERRVSVEAVVDARGHAVLRALLVDGEVVLRDELF